MTSTRSIISPGIFADAANTTIPPTPIQGVSYRNAALPEATVEGGWPYAEIVNSADFNQVLYATTALVRILDRQGVLGWTDLVDYTAASGAIVLGSDGTLYRCILDNGPASSVQDPVSAPTYWQPITLPASTTVSGLVELATTAEAAAGTDTTRAVTAAGVLAALLARAPFNRDIFSSPGVTSWVVPAGVTRAWVVVIGGGGSGRSTSVTSGTVYAGGGGAGGIAYRLVTGLTPGASITVTVGAGGAAATPGANSTVNGNAGGTSSFGAFASATGGAGGAGAEAATGVGSGGDINAGLGDGQHSVTGTVNGAGPGGGPGGGSGNGRSTVNAGRPGASPGAGGGGCHTDLSGNIRSSGAGANGLVAVFW